MLKSGVDNGSELTTANIRNPREYEEKNETRLPLRMCRRHRDKIEIKRDDKGQRQTAVIPHARSDTTVSRATSCKATVVSLNHLVFTTFVSSETAIMDETIKQSWNQGEVSLQLSGSAKPTHPRDVRGNRVAPAGSDFMPAVMSMPNGT